ncbi:MAG: 2-C-methyl-D-erythritol 2,4-cyclodiphosphate synthase [Bacteroidales bacterium]|nr:2-C-methyl-D-erythritol 2,4-cyclodiphosphate synthase [Bacteroidales bacterium]
MRVGIGYDVHKLEPEVPLIIGGIEIPHSKGAIGYSDGDVLIHAMCDALLGAANLRDIGFHFPDTDPDNKGIDSKILLRRVMEMITEKGYTIGNVDSTICLQQPRMFPHIADMKETLAEAMGIDKEQISIKATTTEKLGFVGLEEGISAYAVALIEKKE